MMKNIIIKILKEETMYKVEKNLSPYKKTELQTPTDISVGLMHKAMNDLASALRNIESAMQFAEDEEIIEELEDIRKSLLHSGGNGAGWEGTDEHDNIINKLGTLIDDNSESVDNFNLSGDPDDRAPEGNLQ